MLQKAFGSEEDNVTNWAKIIFVSFEPGIYLFLSLRQTETEKKYFKFVSFFYDVLIDRWYFSSTSWEPETVSKLNF